MSTHSAYTATPKTRNTWKNVMMMKKCDDDIIITFFSGISCFWGSGVHQKYVVWVLVGCKIQFSIQQALLIKIWVKTQGDMLKIQTKKVVFLWQICQINHYGWLCYDYIILPYPYIVYFIVFPNLRGHYYCTRV